MKCRFHINAFSTTYYNKKLVVTYFMEKLLEKESSRTLYFNLLNVNIINKTYIENSILSGKIVRTILSKPLFYEL